MRAITKLEMMGVTGARTMLVQVGEKDSRRMTPTNVAEADHNEDFIATDVWLVDSVHLDNQ